MQCFEEAVLQNNTAVSTVLLYVMDHVLQNDAVVSHSSLCKFLSVALFT